MANSAPYPRVSDALMRDPNVALLVVTTKTPAPTDRTSPRLRRSGGLRPPCSGPARSEHRPAATSRRSLQASIPTDDPRYYSDRRLACQYGNGVVHIWISVRARPDWSPDSNKGGRRRGRVNRQGAASSRNRNKPMAPVTNLAEIRKERLHVLAGLASEVRDLLKRSAG